MAIGRKNTIWGARHISEEKEIERIMREAEKLNTPITKLEASAIISERSAAIFMTKEEFNNIIRRLRGC